MGVSFQGTEFLTTIINSEVALTRWLGPYVWRKAAGRIPLNIQSVPCHVSASLLMKGIGAME